MRIKYSIDKVKINQLKQGNHIVIIGWCINGAGEIPKYNVFINNKEVNFDIIVLPRIDVTKKYKLPLDNCNCGFKIIIDCIEEIGNIKIKANFSDTAEILLNMTKQNIKENTVEETVEYSIDTYGINKDNNIAIVSGWASSYYQEEITYRILDKMNNEVESTIRFVSRDDLIKLKIVNQSNKYVGFMLTFNAEMPDGYQLEIQSDSFYKRIDLDNLLPNTNISIVKNYIHSINRENLIKGLKYFKKNGVKKFLYRLKEGPKRPQVLYHDWFTMHKISKRALEEQKQTIFPYSPKISIIVPTFNTPKEFLGEMIDSVISQSYENWELCIADGSDEKSIARSMLLDYQKKDSRIKVTLLEDNYGIVGNTNKALLMATGDYIALYDHDDVLTPDALYEVVSSLQKTKHDIVYTDEDKLNNRTKKFEDPNFKPDFSIDLFRSHNYITHFFVVKAAIVNEVGQFNSQYEGAQDYDFMFRCIEKSKSIHHIHKVLYHWRMHEASTAENPESKLYCYEAGKKAIEDHYKRVGIKAKVEIMDLWGMYHTEYEIIGNPLISIIIPNMDHKELLDNCINSLLHVNNYSNIEIIIAENNSKTSEIFKYYDQIKMKYKNIKVVTWDKEFNYSAINNFAVQSAKGQYLLFLNNDTEVINKSAISEMLGCCMREEVGIVGAKLLYEDNTVQHAGVVIGFGGYAGHVFHGIEKNDYGYMVRARINGNYSAVTAACMMVDRESFEAVNGFDEQFKVACNDVDLCLRIRKLSKLVVYNAHSLWYHYESKSRGYEDNLSKINRFQNEIHRFQERWKDLLIDGDPYYNKNFKIEDHPFNIS